MSREAHVRICGSRGVRFPPATRRRRYRRMRCCTRDEGAKPMVWWPFAVALQGEIANHREVRRSRAGVLSVAEKARCQRVRCGSRRRARAIPLMKCRKRIGDIQNRGRVIAPGGVWRVPADWPGGCPAWRWRERGLGSGAELGNLSPRLGGQLVERSWPAAGRLEREPQAADLRGGE
jgi:hypothetical protein